MHHLKKYSSFINEEHKSEIDIKWQSNFNNNNIKDMIRYQTYQHVAKMVEDGFTSGELFDEELNYKGWWKINIEEDENDVDTRNIEIAKRIRDGYIGSHNPTYTFSANIWKL